MEESFIKALPILETLNAAGHQAFFVGGSVRDVQLNRPIGDIDIATSALPQQVEELFEKTIPVGIEHGTVIVLLKGERYEVTTFRVEGTYEDFRRPSDVTFVNSLENDLSRRDFTINAMAMDKHGAIIDPYDGRKDLQRRYIQTVGNPDERFSEDPLRMMRAVRFLSQLDFNLSDDTQRSIFKNASLLKNISVERILIEFEKLLLGRGVCKALTLIVELELYQFLPSLSEKKSKLLNLAKLYEPNIKLEEAWTLLVLILGIDDIDNFFKEWKCSNQRIKTIKAYVKAYYELKDMGLESYILYSHGKQTIQSALKLDSIINNVNHTNSLQKSEEIYDDLPIHSRKQLAITGSDLLQWVDKQAGPWLAALLETIEKAVVNKQLRNSKAEIKEWLDSCNPQYENKY